MTIEKYISKQSQEKINARVQSCESKVNAEVVTFFMSKSNSYEEAPLRAFIIGIVLAVTAIMVYEHYNGWHQSILVKDELLTLAFMFSIGATCFALVRFNNYLQRLFVQSTKMQTSVEVMQHSIFSEYKLHETSQKNAILIFVSFFEKHISIKTDSFFAQKIDNTEWDAIINEQMPLLKNKQYEQAFLNAIEQIEQLLLQQGFVANATRTNELTDDLQFNN